MLPNCYLGLSTKVEALPSVINKEEFTIKVCGRRRWELPCHGVHSGHQYVASLKEKILP